MGLARNGRATILSDSSLPSIIVEDQFRAIIEAIGENPEREGLIKTPQRAAKAMEFLTQGYEQDLDEIRALTAPVRERGRCYRTV